MAEKERRTVKTFNASDDISQEVVRSHPLMRVPVPWVFILTYLVGIGLQYVLPLASPSGRGLLISHIAGAILMGCGLALAAWCLRLFHSVRTTTTPGEASVALVTSGPYRFSRNPMYISLTLMYLGEAGLLAQLGPILTLPLVLYYAHRTLIPVEERRLRQVFGDVYEQYCTKTARWI